MTPDEHLAKVTDIANEIAALLQEKDDLDAANPATVGTYERWTADAVAELLKTINIQTVQPAPQATAEARKP